MFYLRLMNPFTHPPVNYSCLLLWSYGGMLANSTCFLFFSFCVYSKRKCFLLMTAMWSVVVCADVYSHIHTKHGCYHGRCQTINLHILTFSFSNKHVLIPHLAHHLASNYYSSRDDLQIISAASLR